MVAGPGSLCVYQEAPNRWPWTVYEHLGALGALIVAAGTARTEADAFEAGRSARRRYCLEGAE